MSYETITLEQSDGVARLTLNRPDKMNALSRDMVGELSDAIKQIARDKEIRAVLMTGNGRGFCAGADLAEGMMRNDGNVDLGKQVADGMERLHNRLVRALAKLEKPVVAAVNGAAAGGGMSLALTADIVIAAKSAYFVLVFGPNLGIVPDMGASWLTPRLIGDARARGMALTGERIPAEQAAEWGMIWKAVDDDALMDEAQTLAAKLAAGPTLGFGLIKRALLASGQNSLDAQLDMERDMQNIAARSHDFSEGVAAFVAKRPPAFKGH